MAPQHIAAGTIDADEVARFSRLAGQWWDPRGPMAALHKFNPVRLAYIRDRVAEHFDRDAKRLDSLAGLRILDPYEARDLGGAWRAPGRRHARRTTDGGSLGSAAARTRRQ